MGRARMYSRQKEFQNKMKFIENQKTKVGEAPKFPLCRGAFDFCPSEDDMKISLSKKLAPNVCGRCAVFDESGRPLPVEQRKPVIDETFLKAFGKKER